MYLVLVSSAKSQCSNLAARVLPQVQVHSARRGKQCLAPMHSANTPALTISHMCKYCTANTELCKYYTLQIPLHSKFLEIDPFICVWLFYEDKEKVIIGG